MTHSVRHFASRNRKTLGPLRLTPLCVVKVLLSCAFQRWWAAFLESLSAVGLYFRLSPCFLCLSKLTPHLSVLVGLSGLEPPTSRLSGVRSNRLSYKPISWFERWFPTRPLVFPASAFVRALCVFQHSVAFSIAVRRTGGDERVRTDDPLLAKQVLSQLSYTPIFSLRGVPFPLH